MASPYYIVYNPLTYNLMDLLARHKADDSLMSAMTDFLSYITGKDAQRLSHDNYLEYLDFSTVKKRETLVDTLAIESYAALYIARQLAFLRPRHQIVLSDGQRKPVKTVIAEKGYPPSAVFITAMSSNFPTAAAMTILLNHGGIPVILGGIHVSTCPDDVETFIRPSLPYGDRIALVQGAGDRATLQNVLKDLYANALKPVYQGTTMIENGVWGDRMNIEALPPLVIDFLREMPVINRTRLSTFQIHPIAPYLGCPYACTFCSISTLPKNQRRFICRDPNDFVEEIEWIRGHGKGLQNRYFFFLPDNLLLGGKKLDQILDRLIASSRPVNYAAQISIEVADNDRLLKKLRASGATHFFIGLESLDLDNLRFIQKNVVSKIIKSGGSVMDYYAEKLKKIQSHGISVHGAFVFGLPYDRFLSMNEHTGLDIAAFCIKNNIGIQPSSLTDLPGALLFDQSQKKHEYLYGPKGSYPYFISLCIADLGETNRIPPVGLMQSPLIIAYMMYECVKRVGHPLAALHNAMYMLGKSFFHPTHMGRQSITERSKDAFFSFFSQMAVSLYRLQGDRLAFSTPSVKGIFERLWANEKDPELKKRFASYVARFMDQRDQENGL